MRSITLVLGGVRSGKSRYALSLAESMAGPRVFVATAYVSDDEMAAKIARHKLERSAAWTTVEETTELGRALRDVVGTAGVVVVDCLTMFAASVMEGREAEVDALVEALAAAPCAVVVVSNEVGSGVVPEYASGRRYRDLLGEINQRVARVADDVILMVAGLPLAVKGRVA
ncbi:adenosylcobinamide kinase /adenosylcobinamide-phosphate guanylyltransferase [Granulicella pectinivorans]|uniref:Adenosylcobinamide kinase n=1 Tax=Granulicella pectinivorans TaxID=474950 RepID=A0A1I6MY83_9BACT|nr:bifunctional adenosylcobinamide kinase/adenosylcobinamide-phosphate guanylyltransferase [Granulicella pectinivorans]SFS20561.1 adenosylcobinamide kinase /adenosylcobinamide-phosphate guanylyltransferase [Granulicella pectinivorans]